MVIAAFLITAFAGMVVGISLSARAAKVQMSVNPVKMLAFVDLLKSKTAAAYSEGLLKEFEEKLDTPTTAKVKEIIEIYNSKILT